MDAFDALGGTVDKFFSPSPVVQKFETGATRSAESNKPDYEGFLSPLVMEAYGRYMQSHRKQADGSIRDSDNWQKGIPFTAYMKSLLRHVFQLHLMHRGHVVKDWDTPRDLTLEEILCAIMFNAMGFLHEHIIKRHGLVPNPEQFHQR